MKYRLSIDLDSDRKLTLWDIAHHAPALVALCLSEIDPSCVSQLRLCRMDAPAPSLEGVEIDIRELLPS